MHYFCWYVRGNDVETSPAVCYLIFVIVACVCLLLCGVPSDSGHPTRHRHNQMGRWHTMGRAAQGSGPRGALGFKPPGGTGQYRTVISATEGGGHNTQLNHGPVQIKF
jgi:hypothetical protein